jgi:hypothetical protein
MNLQIDQIDFDATEALASSMATDELTYAIKDVLVAMKHADEMDRAGLRNNFGKYQDQYHVFTTELNRRNAAK